MLTATNIGKAFASQPVLRDVSLEIASGESLALTGESGSGKSTLIHILAGLESPDSGKVSFDGQSFGNLAESERAKLRRDKFGVVFQQFNLIGSMTAAANVAFQAQSNGQFDQGYCDHVAGELGLSDHLRKYPEELSGGQQQRIAIARAIVARPSVILADEPTGNLDEGTADATLTLLLELVAKTDTALIMATHSDVRAGQLDRKMHLQHGVLV